MVQVRVPAGSERRYGSLIEKLMAAARREDLGNSPKSTYWEPSESPELQWRAGSTPSSDRRRRRLFLPELHRRPAEEIDQPAPSLDPTQPFSSEELRRLAPSLDPTRPFSREATEEPRSVSSLDPYGSCTTQDIRLRRELSQPLSSGSLSGGRDDGKLI